METWRNFRFKSIVIEVPPLKAYYPPREHPADAVDETVSEAAANINSLNFSNAERMQNETELIPQPSPPSVEQQESLEARSSSAEETDDSSLRTPSPQELDVRKWVLEQRFYTKARLKSQLQDGSSSEDEAAHYYIGLAPTPPKFRICGWVQEQCLYAEARVKARLLRHIKNCYRTRSETEDADDLDTDSYQNEF